jgi:protein-tyrosine-phosphatase
MAIDGYAIHLDLSDVRELVTLLRRTSNSLNQLTKRVHETGNIYGEDIEALRESYNRLWDTADEILSRLSII